MNYEELHQRYGAHVSQRLRRELTPREFKSVELSDLPNWLEARAECAHEAYRQLLNNPLAATDELAHTGDACKRWRDAEDLAYLVAIADDTNQSNSFLAHAKAV